MNQELSARAKLWLFIGVILAAVGMAVSIYSINHHRQVKLSGSSDAACNISQTVSCDEVALSEYSEIKGLPLGVYGLGYFAAMGVLAGIGLAGVKTTREHIHAYVAMIGIGIVASIALALISSLIIQKICLVCIGVYAITVLQAVSLVIFRRELPKGADAKSIFSGGLTAAIVVALVATGYTYLIPSQPNTSNKPAEQVKASQSKPTLAPEKKDIPIARSAFAGLGEDYRKGPDDAKVVIVEFADFQCPACKQISGVLEQLAKEFEGKVQVVFRNYPLDNSCNSTLQSKIHDSACRAAMMARCAGQYGKFWQLHDLLFENQKSLSAEQINNLAKVAGLNEEQITSCVNNPDLIAKIKDDIELGNKLGVDATPTLFINGQKVTGGRGLQDLRSQIEQLL